MTVRAQQDVFVVEEALDVQGTVVIARLYVLILEEVQVEEAVDDVGVGISGEIGVSGEVSVDVEVEGVRVVEVGGEF